MKLDQRVFDEVIDSISPFLGTREYHSSFSYNRGTQGAYAEWRRLGDVYST